MLTRQRLTTKDYVRSTISRLRSPWLPAFSVRIAALGIGHFGARLRTRYPVCVIARFRSPSLALAFRCQGTASEQCAARLGSDMSARVVSELSFTVADPAAFVANAETFESIKDATAATLGVSASDITTTRYEIGNGPWQTYATRSRQLQDSLTTAGDIS